MKLKLTLVALLLCGLSSALRASSNIDNVVPNKFAWSENAGWLNWRDANGATQGVNVGGYVMSGFIWGENIGWINVGDGTPAVPPYYANVNGTDYGVNIAADGTLSGFAWSENAGWINFGGGALASPAQPAYVDCSGRLDGFVWSENLGWINLSSTTPGKFVALDAASTPLLCDMNHDGSTDGMDVQAFIDALYGASGDWRDICSGDLFPMPNGDGVITAADIPEFVQCLLSA